MSNKQSSNQPSYEWLSNLDLVEKVKKITKLSDVTMSDKLISNILYRMQGDIFFKVSPEAAYDLYLVECQIMGHKAAEIGPYAKYWRRKPL